MFKISVRHFLFCFTCIVGLMMGVQYLAPVAHAAQGTITLALPNGGPLLGHPGTAIQVAGAGLMPNTAYSLFTTPNNDPAACSPQNAAQLAPFTVPTANTDAAGIFQQTTTWPTNAANATTNYFVCAIPVNGGQNGTGTLSTQSFTVAQQVTITLSAQTVQPGGSVTITGASWVPPQAINVSIIGNAGTVASQQTQPDAMGNFTVTLNIPANAAPGSYTVKAFAPGEPTPAMTVTMANALTVGQQATATATAGPTQQPTSTPVPTHTAGNGGSGGGGGMNALIFGLGGLGAVLVIIGITVYVIYSKKGQPVY